MKTIAIIPARGGSKRLPKKNLRDFFGKPIIAYSIETALESRLFDEVMVSTDNQEIAETSKNYGANIPFIRSQKNSDDYATLNDVITEVLRSYSSKKIKFDLGCCILATSPLISKERLKEGLDILLRNNFNSVWPVVRYSYPIQRALKLKKDSSLSFFNSEHSKSRSQDLEPMYHDASQFYWFKPEHGLVFNNFGGFEISEMESQDIDTEEDWQLLCLKYGLLKKNNNKR